jgi:hypothetical protein
MQRGAEGTRFCHGANERECRFPHSLALGGQSLSWKGLDPVDVRESIQLGLTPANYAT